MNSVRWKQRFDHFEKAYKTFSRLCTLYEQNPNAEVNQLALVQGYEFTFELCWKVLKDYLEHEGFAITTPRQALVHAFQSNLIAHGEQWLAALAYRNALSHTYSEEVLHKTVAFIKDTFAPLVNNLYATLKKQK